MVKRFLVPLLAAVIVVAMVVPGCNGVDPTVEYDLTVQVSPEGAGTTTPTGTTSVAGGATVSLSAQANEGWAFVNWTASPAVGFIPDALDPNAQFDMPGSAVTITANFDTVRTEGFWLDRIIIEKDQDQTRAVERLKDGEFDVYGHTLDDLDLFDIVDDDPNLWYKESIGSLNTFRINPYGPEFDTGMLNPFHTFDFPNPETRQVQEILHKFIDRNMIGGVIMGGLGVPRFTSFHPLLADYARYVDGNVAPEAQIEALEEEYEFDPVTGALWLADTMAEIDLLVDGDITGDQATGWFYTPEGGTAQPISMTVAIRSDDPIRDLVGDYLIEQLQDMGFDAVPFKGDMDATLFGLVNVTSQITGGGWTIYTGGWVSTVLLRDEAYWFIYFHTNAWAAGIPAYAYLLGYSSEFWDAAMDLLIMNFTSFAERDALVEVCLPEHMTLGMFYLTATQGFTPLWQNVDMAADTAGGIYGSWMWALTAHFRDPVTTEPIFGGDMRITLFDLLVGPWNPVAGSNSVYDMFPIRATGDMGHHPDTRDGLRWAGRILGADVTVSEDLPIRQDTPDVPDWINLILTPDPIEADLDAWRDWDPVTGEPRTVADALANPGEDWGLDSPAAARHSVAYYPADIFDHPLHDGSTMSYADFLYAWVLGFHRGQDTDLYDKTAEIERGTTLSSLKGVKFTLGPDNHPIFGDWGLKVEVWSTIWETDPERMIGTGFPNYAQGNGHWHTIALAALAERDNALAFGEAKSKGYVDLGVPASTWTSFIAGSSLPILNDYLQATLDYLDAGDPLDGDVIPFYEFIVAEYGAAFDFDAEVEDRMNNLDFWVNERDNPYRIVDGMGHFWVNGGPYYLANVGLVPPFVILEAFEDYPDDRDRWFFLLDDLDY